MSGKRPIPWTIERPHQRTAVVRMDQPKSLKGWEQFFLLRSDAHHDNAHSNREAELRHLEEARDRNAGIIDVGDLFCAMQGKWDKRADRSAMREEYQVGSYLDALVNVAAEHYAPFAPWWIAMSDGNHETSITRRHETRLLERLVARLNGESGGQIQHMPYSFYVKLTIGDGKRNAVTPLLYHGFHGAGGGGPVTRGVIQTNRRAVSNPAADVIHTGHVHEAWHVRVPAEFMRKSGKPYIREASHVCTPGYKDEYSCGSGWHVERGAAPKPMGAAWLRVYVGIDDSGSRVMKHEIREAIA